MVCEGVPFPKTHRISDLANLLPARLQMLLPTDEQERLTTYATVTRYPGAYDPIPLSEAKHAVAIARLVRREIRKAYPASVKGTGGGRK